jgi:hypothetical protein
MNTLYDYRVLLEELKSVLDKSTSICSSESNLERRELLVKFNDNLKNLFNGYYEYYRNYCERRKNL